MNAFLRIIFSFVFLLISYLISGQSSVNECFLKYTTDRNNPLNKYIFEKSESAWKKNDSAVLYVLENNTYNALHFINESEQLNSNDTLLRYLNLGLKGIIFYRKDNYKKSLKFLNKSINFFNTQKKTFIKVFSLALFYQFKGRNLSDMGFFSSAVNSYLTSNIYFNDFDSKSKTYENYKFIGRVYQKNNINNKHINAFAEENYKIALKGFKSLRKYDEVAWMYLVLSDFYTSQNKTETALRYQDSCFVSAKKIRNKELTAISLNNFGEIFLKENKLSLANRYFLKAIKHYKKIRNVKNLQVSYYNLSELNYIRTKFSVAELFIDSAIYSAVETANNTLLLKSYLLKKNILEKEQKNVTNLFNEYIILSDKMKEEQQSNMIFFYQEYFQSQKLKEKNTNLQLVNKKQTNRLNLTIVISGIVFLIFILSIAIFQFFRKKKEAKLNEKLQRLHMQSVQAQLYPHLLFNIISAAGSVIFKEKREVAYDFLVKMSQLMRKALEDSKKLYKTLEQEIEFVKNYLEIQKIRFPERFIYHIFIDKTVDLSIQVPQMIIQTYVENAVKYGLEPLKKGGILRIKISNELNSITISVEDNGIGIKAAKELTQSGTGNGLKIMNEIYAVHNKKSKTQIVFNLIDLYGDGKKGTLSRIQIKQ